MNDLFSKATFGFLMAQFMPGVLTTISLVIVLFCLTGAAPNSLLATAIKAMTVFDGPVLQQVALVGVCTGAGMTIHGLHWAVLGFLENHPSDANRTAEPQPISATFCHTWPIWSQVLVGPMKLAVEIVLFLVRCNDIEEAAIEE